MAGVPVGCGFAWWETRDDPDLVMVYLTVAPEHRRRGIGTTLATRMREALTGRGFSRALCGVNTAPSSAAPLTTPDGEGAVDGTHPGVRMALRAGFQLAQASVWSRYDLHHPALDPAPLLADAEAAAGPDYAVVAWEGAAPSELLPGLARLKERMRADMPVGGVELSDSRWDEQRVRDDDERRLRANRLWRAAVRHVPSGDLVALSELQQSVALPRSFVGQWDTVVLPDHRGRRLGLLVKAANILQLRGKTAEGVEINTCNAVENTHMRAINRQLGFREYLWSGSFVTAGEAATPAP